MKPHHLILILAGIALLLLNGCKEEPFNPRADWKDISIIYGLLDPADETHYVRINKAFLGPGNAVIWAQNPDSIYYPLEDIDAKVIQYNTNGKAVNTYSLTPIELEDKEQGVFAKKNIVYQFTKKISLREESGHTYNIEIVNNKTGKTITSEKNIPLVNFSMYRGINRGPAEFDPQKTAQTLNLDPISNCRSFDAYYVFYYGEAPAGTRDTALYSIDSLVWHMASTTVSKNATDAKITYNPQSFYAFLKTELPDEPNKTWRIVRNTNKTIIWGGDETLFYYVNVNKPSGVVTERPEYTNLISTTNDDDVFGIFCSRYHIELYSPLSGNGFSHFYEAEVLGSRFQNLSAM